MNEQQYAAFGQGAFGTVSGSKLARIRQYAGPTILDVGCGPGLYLAALTQLGYHVAGVDGNSVFIQEARQITDQVYQADLDVQGLTQFGAESFETILLLDILEHVEDDEKLLREAARVARRNVLISVPTKAPEGLHDTQLMLGSYSDPTHRRYYSFEDLQTLLQKAGFTDFRVVSALGFTPVLFAIFPWYLRYPLKALNYFLRRVTDPKQLTSVWFAVGWKSNLPSGQ